MSKLIPGILTIAIMAAACGSGDGTEVSAAARASAPAQANVPAPAAEPAPEPPLQAPKLERGSRPVPRAASPRAAAVPARSESASIKRAAAAPAAAVPEYREFTLPAGTMLRLELKSSIASDVSEVEDTIRATLRNAITIDGEEVLPAGTELAGNVTEAERAGRVKGRARLAFRFTSLRYQGERMALQTDPIVQEAEATKGEDATKIGVGAGAGAVIGAIVGGKSGAAKGALLGGAAGTGAVMATRGKEVHLEAGTEVPARLAAPLAIQVRVH